MYDNKATYIVIGVILILKLIFWAMWFCYRRQRQRRLLEAGLIREAPSVATVSTVPTGYNTQYWTPAAHAASTGPPSYDTVTAMEAGKEALPPSYQEAVRSN